MHYIQILGTGPSRMFISMSTDNYSTKEILKLREKLIADYEAAQKTPLTLRHRIFKLFKRK